MMNKRLERKDFDYSQVFDAAIESYREDTARYLRQNKEYCLLQNNEFISYANDQNYDLFQESIIEEDEFEIFKKIWLNYTTINLVIGNIKFENTMIKLS